MYITLISIIVLIILGDGLRRIVVPLVNNKNSEKDKC